MSRFAGRGFGGLGAVLIAVAAMVPAAGQAKHSVHSHGPGKLAQAAEITLREGRDANLPPHISTLLGLTREQEYPVKQGVIRTGSMVQGIDVSTANKSDIVLFVVDESTKDQKLYLTSPEGILRKVVSVKAGEGSVTKITEKEQESFKKEKQFWIDKLVPASGGK